MNGSFPLSLPSGQQIDIYYTLWKGNYFKMSLSLLRYIAIRTPVVAQCPDFTEIHQHQFLVKVHYQSGTITITISLAQEMYLLLCKTG